jgi:autotransporter-associated beta strand protein
MNNDTSFSQTALRQLGEVGGQFYGSSVDSVVARAYNRRFGTNNYSLFSDSGVEPSPDGFYQFNYSPLGIYRRGTWVASIRAPQRYFWSAEIWTNSNVYGRYQGYGALEMLYSGKVVSRAPKDANGNNISKTVTVRSGQSIDGWDWSQPPGTTTIALPHEKLGMKEREDVRSQLNFSGALAFRADQSGAQSQSGLYAANFQESRQSTIVGLNHNLTFVWRKSWFCFDSQIVCLGSDITNQNAAENAAHPTVTTLFQGVLPARSTAITLNNTPITTFPYAPTAVSGAGANWLLDAYGTGFIVQPQTGNTLKISRTNQESAHHTGSGATTTDDFAKAWIDHGTSPSGAGYEYAVFPATTASAMVTAATSHANAATKPYQVLQRDRTAHVVKWKASGQLGYAIFITSELINGVPTPTPLSTATQNAGLLISVERPCLVMAQLGTGADAWISVVDPDLNFSNLRAAYGLPDASVARTLDFTVHGTWLLGSSSAGTGIVSSPGSTNTTIRVTTQHGIASHVRLVAPLSTGVASWVNLGSDWADPANWGANWGGSPPANDPATDIAALGAASVQPVLDTSYAVKGITLDGGTTLAGSGNLALGSGGVVATGTDNAFSLSSLTLQSGQTWNVGAGTLDVSSAIAGPASASLTKTGLGTQILTGNNTYTGDTVISQGGLQLAAGASLRFRPLANSVNNRITVGPAATVTLSGSFDLDLTGAALASGNTWTLISSAASTTTFTPSFQVAGFTKSTPPAGNVWTKLDGPRTWTFTEATGVLRLQISSYAGWISAFPTLADIIPGGDSDHDGVPNLLEYVLGGDPTLPDAGTFLPSFSPVPGGMRFAFRRTDASESDAALTFQYSRNLVSWSDLSIGAVSSGPDANGVAFTVEENDADADLITITVPVDANARTFGRLRAATSP